MLQTEFFKCRGSRIYFAVRFLQNYFAFLFTKFSIACKKSNILSGNFFVESKPSTKQTRASKYPPLNPVDVAGPRDYSVISFRPAKLRPRRSCLRKDAKEWVAKSRRSRRICATVRMIFRKDRTLLVFKSAHASPDLSSYNAGVWTRGERKACNFLFFGASKQSSISFDDQCDSVDRLLDFFFLSLCNVANDCRGPNRSIELIQYTKCPGANTQSNPRHHRFPARYAIVINEQE